MAKRSAGLLMFRVVEDEVEVFLVHPGGPLWAKKDKGSWTIPKGEYEPDEDPLVAARREFEEETGFRAAGKFLELAEEWEGCERVGVSGGLRPGQTDEQHVCHRMASAFRNSD